MDPFRVLGVRRDALPEDLAAAYRRAAKRWHPDRNGGQHSEARMAEINAAYDLLRDGGWRSAQVAATASAARPDVRRRRRAHGSWLPESVRHALGGELIAALKDGEEVSLVAPAATWASPLTILAVTDRRLLWLNDDALGHRVQSVPFDAITDIRLVRRRFRSHLASVQVHTTVGRRLSFAELRPAMAGDIVRRVSAATKRS